MWGGARLFRFKHASSFEYGRFLRRKADQPRAPADILHPSPNVESGGPEAVTLVLRVAQPVISLSTEPECSQLINVPSFENRRVECRSGTEAS